MDKRLKLQLLLENIFKDGKVYYQPPENIKMVYPAIVYSKDDIDMRHANDNSYISYNKYSITVIDKKPDNKIITELLKIPMCSFDTHYVSDNLHHDVLILYF